MKGYLGSARVEIVDSLHKFNWLRYIPEMRQDRLGYRCFCAFLHNLRSMGCFLHSVSSPWQLRFRVNNKMPNVTLLKTKLKDKCILVEIRKDKFSFMKFLHFFMLFLFPNFLTNKLFFSSGFEHWPPLDYAPAQQWSRGASMFLPVDHVYIHWYLHCSGCHPGRVVHVCEDVLVQQSEGVGSIRIG